MSKKIQAAKIIQEINDAKSDKMKTSLYLSESVYRRFKKALGKGGPSPSVVIEKLMVDFLESLDR